MAQQALREKVLGHVQAPGQVWARGLSALEYLQQQAFETDGQFAAQAHEQCRWRFAAAIGQGVVTILIAEALQRALSFE
ncbi:hypothetical protein D9M68_892030 [compost metagenome]